MLFGAICIVVVLAIVAFSSYKALKDLELQKEAEDQVGEQVAKRREAVAEAKRRLLDARDEYERLRRSYMSGDAGSVPQGSGSSGPGNSGTGQADSGSDRVNNAKASGNPEIKESSR